MASLLTHELENTWAVAVFFADQSPVSFDFHTSEESARIHAVEIANRPSVTYAYVLQANRRIANTQTIRAMPLTTEAVA